MAVVVKRTGKLEKEIMIGGVLLIVGFLAWNKFFSPKSKCKHILKAGMKSPDRENRYQLCMEKNNPGWVHAPLT